MDLNFEGEFWLPEQPDKKVAGTLKLSQSEGTELSLIGGFGSQGMTSFWEDSETVRRIIGSSTKELYTLDRCFQTHGQMNFSGAHRQKYSVGLIIEGASYAKDEELTFDGIGVEVTNFLNWAGVSGVSQEFSTSPKNGYSIKVEGLDTVSAPFSDGNIEVRHGYRTSSKTNREFTIRQFADVKFSFNSILSLSRAMDYASDLQDLVTMATDRVCSFEEFLLYHPDFTEDNERMGRQSVKLLVQQVAQAGSEKHVFGDSIAFSFSDIGEIDGIVRWMEACKKYRSQLGRVMATKYNRYLYVSDKFFGRAAALESLHKAVSGKSNMTYRNRILECIGDVSAHFKLLVPDNKFNRWATVIKDDRNNIAHHAGRILHQHEAELYFFGEAAYWLFVLYYLKIGDAPNAALDRVTENGHFKWTAQRMLEFL
ncbi:hypothetical protein K8Z49_43120 [Actinomadura madurae]|uniref:ApeA N-terminal domain 1-containing protein n=1 Tax=Actinomadura madurae TaxID=1993 RepID=UPI00399A3BD6